MRVWVLGTGCLLLAACAPPTLPTGPNTSTAQGERASATVLLGTVDRGFGDVGVALLARVTDEDAESWQGELLDDEGRTLAGFAQGDTNGQWVPRWWHRLPARYGGRYVVRFFTHAGRELRVAASLPATSGLAAPQPELEATGTLAWAPIARAAAYHCSTTAGVLGPAQAVPGCTLPVTAGQVTTLTVRALTVDVTAPPADDALPSSFDISETDFTAALSASGARVHGVLGAMHYAPGAMGLAALVSVKTAGAGAPSEDWHVEVRGGSLGPTGVMSGEQLAGSDRLILWSYSAAPGEGLYEVRASSGTDVVALSLRPAAAPALPEVTGLTVDPRGAGGAIVTWQAVSGARGYYASVWATATGALLASSWVTDPRVSFPPGSFTPGQRCDVYVAASSAAPTAGAALPSTLSLSENTLRPFSFVSM